MTLNVQLISAFDSDPSSTGNGLLVSEPNAKSDDPRLTQIVSPVTLPGIPCAAYWAAVVLADQNYDDNLPYHPTPQSGLWTVFGVGANPCRTVRSSEVHKPWCRPPPNARTPVVRAALVSVLAVFTGLSLNGCEPQYHHTGCWLPVLRTDAALEVLVHVGDADDRSSNVCPVPVARTFRAERSYGTVDFEWWGSPHRLYMSAKAADGEPLNVRGAGIEIYEDTADSWLARYDRRRTFSGNNLLERPVPQPVSIEITTRDGRLLDTIQGTYDTEQCSCSVPEGIEGPAGR